VNTGPVKILSTNGVTMIDSERFIYKIKCACEYSLSRCEAGFWYNGYERGGGVTSGG